MTTASPTLTGDADSVEANILAFSEEWYFLIGFLRVFYVRLRISNYNTFRRCDEQIQPFVIHTQHLTNRGTRSPTDTVIMELITHIGFPGSLVFNSVRIYPQHIGFFFTDIQTMTPDVPFEYSNAVIDNDRCQSRHK